jgi:catechol 2,3-dioxygenase-like lactoylglutathione lyase family enzyme
LKHKRRGVVTFARFLNARIARQPEKPRNSSFPGTFNCGRLHRSDVECHKRPSVGLFGAPQSGPQPPWSTEMNSAPSSGTIVAILPCNDLDASERFYNRLGFVRRAESGDPDYRILSNRAGGNLHLTRAAAGWLVPGRNPFGLYLYLKDVDGLATAFQSELSGRRGPEGKPWGMYEFAMSDPDGTLVRVGWPN